MPDILTVTMNPAVDISTATQKVEPTHKVRCGVPQRHPGGGGINVARVVHRLGGSCTALFTAGGDTGKLLRHMLNEEGVSQACIDITGETRESFSVSETSTGQEYRFVLPGPELLTQEWQHCLDFVAALEKPPRYIVASGGLPPGVPVDFYAKLSKIAKSMGVQVILDTAGPALAAGLEEPVFMVKPSLRELRELMSEPLETEEQWRKAAGQLVSQGKAQVVVLTLGERGAWLLSHEGTYYAPGLPVKVVGAIGAGDSFVGAMVWARASGFNLKESFRYGLAAGSASLLAGGTGLCDPEDVRRLYKEVSLNRR